MRQALIRPILAQPTIEVLFRPEEIVDRSATSLLNVNRVRVDRDQLSLAELDGDPVAAMRAGIFDRKALVSVLVAVDQQQEVDSSPNVEGFFAFDRYRVEVVA